MSQHLYVVSVEKGQEISLDGRNIRLVVAQLMNKVSREGGRKKISFLLETFYFIYSVLPFLRYTQLFFRQKAMVYYLILKVWFCLPFRFYCTCLPRVPITSNCWRASSPSSSPPSSSTGSSRPITKEGSAALASNDAGSLAVQYSVPK